MALGRETFQGWRETFQQVSRRNVSGLNKSSLPRARPAFGERSTLLCQTKSSSFQTGKPGFIRRRQRAATFETLRKQVDSSSSILRELIFFQFQNCTQMRSLRLRVSCQMANLHFKKNVEISQAGLMPRPFLRQTSSCSKK